MLLWAAAQLMGHGLVEERQDACLSFLLSLSSLALFENKT